MASVYKKGNKIYLSWYDPFEQKRKNVSLKLDYNKKNLLIAKKKAKIFQEKLREEKEKLVNMDIRKETIKNAFNHFLRNNSHKAEKTKKDYFRFYKKFTEQFNPDDLCTVINKIEVERWLCDIKTLNLSANSIFGYYKQLNHFLNFLFEYNYTSVFIINKAVKPRKEIVPKIVFTDSELKRIFNGLSGKNRNFKVLIYLAFYTGLRSSDILSIRSENINFEEQTLSYYSPKRKMTRTIAFHDELVKILRHRVEEIGNGTIIKYKTVESFGRAVTSYFKQIKLRKGLTARTFRKSFITRALEAGINKSVVRELVGHEHSSTTDKYYNSISIQQMLSELRKYKLPDENDN